MAKQIPQIRENQDFESKKKSRKIRSFFLVLTILSFIGVYYAFLNHQYNVLAALERTRSDVRKETEAQLELTEQLEEEKILRNSDEYIKKIAREILGLYMPDEIVFKKK